MSQSNFWKDTAPVIQNVTNTTSLVSSILTFLLVSMLRYYRPYIFNRVSLRFQGLIALIDVIRHTILLGMDQTENSRLCVAISFLGFYFDHFYIIVNAIIALNLHLTFFHNVCSDKRIEALLLGGGILNVTILDSVPFLYGFYGRSGFGNCFISAEGQYRVFFKVLLIYVVQLVGMGYCFFVFVSVFLHLRVRKNSIKAKVPNKTIILYGESVNARDFIKKLYRRIAIYPMASVVCFLPYILSSMYKDLMGSRPSWIGFVAILGVLFSGTANLIVPMFDPHFQFAIKDVIKKGLNYFHVSKKELQADVDLRMIEELEEDHKCLVELPGQKNVAFKDFIIFI